MNQHHTDLHALAAAYALNAVDPAEREAFSRHLQHCAECRQEVAEFEATAARLAVAVARAPSAAMKQRTLSAIDGVRQLPPRVPAPAAAHRSGGGLLRKAGPFALVACLAAASFASLAAWQHEQGEQSAQRALQAEERLDAVSSVLAAPDARTSQGKAANGALMTFVSSDRRNMAVVTATGLPSPAPGTTYQLWLDVDGSMRPAGFLHGDGTVPVKGDPAAATAVGLTVEPAGGSSRPTTDPLLLMALPA
ncbi:MULTISPECIES: anti-sigma factor [unclassified Streptomyces]|uniref:anti-sigma factor n=1 Tax=unclassified Streptomyces TaxID=2593676 RepID=UPI002E2AB008|nr:anti-sigma factor [Streptomyces sp. NBC_01439]